MNFIETALKGAYIVTPEKISDSRGFFARSLCANEFKAIGLNTQWMQGNISFNPIKGTLRGLHYQASPYEEVKLIRCTRGEIYDVIIDLRPDSSTYMKWVGVKLSADNYKMLYMPEGFAHGYQTLTDNVDVFYLVSQFYTPRSECGIRFDDPAFNIEWPITDGLVISEKDKAQSNFSA